MLKVLVSIRPVLRVASDSVIFKENSKRPLAADTVRFSFLAAYKATDMAK